MVSRSVVNSWRSIVWFVVLCKQGGENNEMPKLWAREFPVDQQIWED